MADPSTGGKQTGEEIHTLKRMYVNRLLDLCRVGRLGLDGLTFVMGRTQLDGILEPRSLPERSGAKALQQLANDLNSNLSVRDRAAVLVGALREMWNRNDQTDDERRMMMEMAAYEAKALNSDIQIDMFEVQLGAAVLLQFRNAERGVVRVLADAGVTASGYPLETVHDRLTRVFEQAQGAQRRLDLIIGTHYDADHLEGFVPIIEDHSIEIGEAWMPPVANDTDPHTSDEAVQERHLLAYQLSQGDADERLRRYLDAKRAVCEEIRRLEHVADEFRIDRTDQRGRIEASERVLVSREWIDREGGPARAFRYFRAHIADANQTLGTQGYSHADDDVGEVFWIRGLDERGWEVGNLTRLPRGWEMGATTEERLERFTMRWRGNREAAESDARNLAYIRRSAAQDAINAASLAKVVRALMSRSIPIMYRMIQDGTPRRFVWMESSRRFVPGSRLKPEGPELVLLGPSEGLVKKHWDRLPLGDYTAALSYAAIPIKTITPSNQLSYVARFEFKEQGILVAGDAGCVDFKPSRGSYCRALIDALLPLHVIQVAHHGGNNAHFYRVLLEARYAEQEAPSLLLLSHAQDDKYRPSKEFGMFIENIRKEGDDVKLLFTSQPTLDKVRDYKEIVHPVVGRAGKVGDVRICFDEAKWVVLSHAVCV